MGFAYVLLCMSWIEYRIYWNIRGKRGLIYGEAYIQEEKYFNFQSVKLIFFFFSIKDFISAFFTRRMHGNTWGRVKFLVNMMFGRLDKFDWLIFEGAYIWGVGLGEGLIFGMLIGLHIWWAYIGGGAYMRGSVLTEFHIYLL